MRHVLIVDDQPLVRAGIITVLQQLNQALQVSEATLCDEAVTLVQARRLGESPIDLVLLDLNLPDRQGFDSLDHFRAMLPETPVVVVSGQDDAQTVYRALEKGARSFLSKAADRAVTREALQALVNGEVWLPPSSALIDAGALVQADQNLSIDALTERQLEVLSLLIQGLSNKLIARRLGIAESTVKIHVSAILREFGVATRTQALLEVARRRWRLPGLKQGD